MQNNTGINKVFLIGKIQTEPRRHKITGDADKLCFTLATTESLKKGDSATEHIEHHHMVLDPRIADVKIDDLTKGALIHVIGKIQTKMWIDVGNIRRYKTEIIVQQVQVLAGQSVPVLH